MNENPQVMLVGLTDKTVVFAIVMGLFYVLSVLIVPSTAAVAIPVSMCLGICGRGIFSLAGDLKSALKRIDALEAQLNCGQDEDLAKD